MLTMNIYSVKRIFRKIFFFNCTKQKQLYPKSDLNITFRSNKAFPVLPNILAEHYLQRLLLSQHHSPTQQQFSDIGELNPELDFFFHHDC